MRKLPAAVLIVAMLMILAILFVFMCLPLGQKRVNAVDGILDLRGGMTSGQLYLLGGEWQFLYGELTMPEAFPEQAELISVPSSWEDLGFSPNNCATYRLTIQTDCLDPMMLYIPEISSAYALWISGEYARGSGAVTSIPSEGRPLFENALIPVWDQNGGFELVIQVSNYHYFRNGITMPLLFGKSEAVLSWFFRTRALYCIALGCILMMAFYHLVLYIFRRGEKAYLIFSLLCTLCFVRFLMETNGINQFFKWIPVDDSGIGFFVVLYFLHCVIIMLFTLFIFNKKFLSSHKYIAVTYLVAGIFLSSFMPYNIPYAEMVIMVSILPFILLTIIISARSPVLRENKWARLYFASLLVYAFLGSATKLLFEPVLFMSGLLTNIFMIMAQSLVLSRSYADAFLFVEHTNENLERIVEERTKDLTTTNGAMKELIGNISHDLKTPLTVMSVNLEKLLSVRPGEEGYQKLARIAYNKNLDLQRITQNLFDVSRIEARQDLYSPEWVPLNGLLSSLQEKYGDFLESRGLYLDVSSVCGDADIYTDPRKIWNVFDNIIYNAVRYTKNGGITVTAETLDSNANIAVSDTGCGIAPEHLPYIFDRFYKVSSDRGAQGGDSGVGLYIVKSVMEGCGGGAAVESEIGKGTSIILTFMLFLDSS